MVPFQRATFPAQIMDFPPKHPYALFCWNKSWIERKKSTIPFKESTISFWNPFSCKKPLNDSADKVRTELKLPSLRFAIATSRVWDLQQGRRGSNSFYSRDSRPFYALFWQHRKDSTEMAWRCLLCPSFTALWLVSLLTHYNSNHSHEDRRFTIRCDIEGCTKEYCKVNSFTKHVRSVHRRFLHCSTNDIRGEPVLLEGKLWIVLFTLH